MIYIYPYKQVSASAKKLASTMGRLRLKNEGKPVKKGTVINWGASAIEREIDPRCRVINRPEAVRLASNKLTAFHALKEAGVSVPDFVESKEDAMKMLADGKVVVARTKLNAHSGEGIVICDPDKQEDLPEAKLYTQYIPKAEEYRLHVMGGRVFFTQRKARSKDVPDDQVNWKVRNLANGFIFANQEIVMERADTAFSLAVVAVQVLGLDFGAVDLIYNRKTSRYYVLEVNTAPGLSGSTLEAYSEAFNEEYGNE